MNKTLKELRPGESGKVAQITATGNMRRKLLDMGITTGVDIIMRKTAPFGDPISFYIRGYELSVRKSIASTILMDCIDEPVASIQGTRTAAGAV